MSIVITKAEWDKRGKTQFFSVEGEVEVNSYEDEVDVTFKGAMGINPNIPIVEVSVKDSDGPRKRQMVHFVMPPHMMTGEEEWVDVQVICGDDSAVRAITALNWVKDNSSISSLLNKRSRIYVTGEPITEDFVPDRVNIELSDSRIIARIWFG